MRTTRIRSKAGEDGLYGLANSLIEPVRPWRAERGPFARLGEAPAEGGVSFRPPVSPAHVSRHNSGSQKQSCSPRRAAALPLGSRIRNPPTASVHSGSLAKRHDPAAQLDCPGPQIRFPEQLSDCIPAYVSLDRAH